MERKNITIRPAHSDWIQENDVNLSQFVQERIDDEMGPSDEEIAQAYRDNAENAHEMNERWSNVSKEANQHLGENPLEDDA